MLNLPPQAFVSAIENGYAHVPDALDSDLIKQILAETDGVPLKAAVPVLNGVVQNYDHWTLRYPGEIAGVYPALTRLIAQLGDAARKAGQPGWWPNQASFHSYPRRKVGIGPHRDHKNNLGFVFVAGLTGLGGIGFYDDDRSTLNDVVGYKAGEAILLRGWTPGATVDPRPIHGASGARRRLRRSLSIRMNVRSQSA